jgi:DNA-binding CsgD family transcriptional regulator
MRLLGRQAECARVDALLEAARAGGSGALVLVGEPGIGKTALLSYATAHAQDMTKLAARGVEAERDLPFAALADLLHPLTPMFERLPDPQAAALHGAFAAGPDISPARFATAAATLAVLGIAAEEGPVLVTVDDAHWLDPATAEALLFAARRLEREGVAMLIATRPGEGTFADTELESLALEGLEAASAAALVSKRAPGAASEVVSQLVRATAGNPLALTVLPSLLTAEELSGQRPLPTFLPVGRSLARVFGRRVRSLPRETQAALLVVAAAGSAPLAEVRPALELLGLAGALDAAEAEGLVTVTPTSVEFDHPLIGSVIYSDASPPERRRIHGVLAQTASGLYAEERRAWHTAAAIDGPDESAAAALEHSAGRARQRGGLSAEAEILMRAAELTPDPERRSRRRLAAAQAASSTGRMTTASALAEQAFAETTDPLQRARVRGIQGRLATGEGASRLKWTALVDAAGDAEQAEPSLTVELLAYAANIAVSEGAHDAADKALRHALRLSAELGDRLDASSAVVLAHNLVYCGRESEGYALAARLQSALDDADVLANVQTRIFLASLLLWVEEYESAREVIERTIDAARTAGALGFLPLALDTLAAVDTRLGRWPEAYAESTEALQLADATGQRGQKSSFLSTIANLEALQGREAESRAHAEEALELARRDGHTLNAAYAIGVLGRLELAIGQPEAAIRYLSRLEDTVRSGPGVVEPGVVPMLPELVEAHVRARRPEDAQRVLDEFQVQAARAQSMWALAAAARCRGLLAPEDGFDVHFREALTWHARTPQRYEQARTELCFGERLRRARRHSEARDVLRSALDTFDRLGAIPWADRAATELGSGARVSRGHAALSTVLSAKELQVALVVARGATNREAAAALFLSPKTIEAHLSRVYEKLGIRSRTELAVLLADGAGERELLQEELVHAAARNP